MAATLRIGFVVGSVAELLAPFALVWKPFRYVFIGVMLPMHVLILLVMNIGFFENMAMFVLLIDMGARRRQSACIVLFDGVCHFCNRFITFLQARDTNGELYFTASQSDAGRELMRQYRISEKEVGQTIYVLEGSRAFSRSTGVLKIVSRLCAPWHLLASLTLFPVILRDAVYKIISTNRYRWFGKASECRVPTERERRHFLQTQEDVVAFQSSGGKAVLSGEAVKLPQP